MHNVVSENISPTGPSTLAALILFFEKPFQTIECLKSLLPFGMDIYVLNNASSAEARKIVGNFCEGVNRIHIIDSSVNLGVAGGRNKLIRETTHEWMLFLDSDIVVITPDMISRFHAHLAANPDAEVLVGRFFNLHSKSWEQFLGEKEKAKNISRFRLKKFPGGATFIRRTMFTRIGFYNEEMFIGKEDFDYLYKAKERNQDIVALLMEDVAFLHDHRRMSRPEDKAATLLRYDREINLASAKLMVKDDAGLVKLEAWLEEQKTLMLGPSSLSCRATPTKCMLHMMPAHSNGQGAVRPMTVRLVECLLQQYPGITECCLGGGSEAALAPEFCRIVRYLHGEGKSVSLVTDGHHAEPIFAVREYFDRITIRLQADFFGSSRWKQRMSAIYRKLQHDTGTVGFVYVVRKNSMQELQEVFRLCDAMKPAFLQLDDFIASDLKDPWPFETLVTSPSSSFTAELLEPMRHRPYVVIPPRIPDFSHTVNACKSYFDFISLDGNGNIGGCRTSYVPDAAFGNILSSSDVYNTYEMMRLRHNQELGFPAHPECVYCYNNWPEAENNACVGQRPDLPSHSFCFGKTSEGI